MTVDIRCTTNRADGRPPENLAYAAASQEEVMPRPDADQVALALADALPADAMLQTELVAVGMLVTALICNAEQKDRCELVEMFCELLRNSVAGELN